MNADIDMSGRIEETNKPTVLAVANGIAISHLLSAREKRKVIASLSQKKPDRRRAQVHILVFSSLLFLLLKDTIGAFSTVYVDDEYPSHAAVIKNRVMTLLIESGINLDRNQIAFSLVGKKSPAHKIAYATFQGRRSANRVLTAKNVLETFEK